MKPRTKMMETMTTSSNPVAFFIPISPIPASRPRVSRWGTYYGKRYTAWRKKAASELALFEHPTTLTGPLKVTLMHVVEKPKTSKLMYPRGDVDNYDKAAMDAVTNHTSVWKDDDQVVKLTSMKLFASEDAEPGSYIRIEPIEYPSFLQKAKDLLKSPWR